MEEANLLIARKFIEEFLGQGKMELAEELLDQNIQVITGLKPTGAIAGIEKYKQVFSSFFDAFPPVEPLRIEDIFAADDRVVVRFNHFRNMLRTITEFLRAIASLLSMKPM